MGTWFNTQSTTGEPGATHWTPKGWPEASLPRLPGGLRLSWPPSHHIPLQALPTHHTFQDSPLLSKGESPSILPLYGSHRPWELPAGSNKGRHKPTSWVTLGWGSPNSATRPSSASPPPCAPLLPRQCWGQISPEEPEANITYLHKTRFSSKNLPAWSRWRPSAPSFTMILTLLPVT